MNRIEKVMRGIKENKEKAFIPYIMAGDGGLGALQQRIIFLEETGATAIEIGIPFSDPVADGPVIQAAGIRALQEGTTLKAVIQTIAGVRPIVHVPLIIMTYMNPIIAYGIEKFIEYSCHAGIDGLILPDLPIEEETMVTSLAEKFGIEIIRLVTLTSPLERIREISSKGKGFIYAVTINGITGARNGFDEEAVEHLKRVKSVSTLPVFAGFGISTSSHVEEMIHYCDGVIVGSKIVEFFSENDLSAIKELIRAAKIKRTIKQ
ncbi:tryptophan synthase subunit alpha [Cytobacillus praedii]|uniref:tryptophan synthase subunit alpha n=1 Tax=Cytobacillus praedii TaxID=1742358 RepID=UPI002E1E16CB|nr:tryptophan synthase subunit alpha [Cytobacillus praedii]MED3572246.1 tryptophan synthase subunit alpha [Cytobacillus praedii]